MVHKNILLFKPMYPYAIGSIGLPILVDQWYTVQKECFDCRIASGPHEISRHQVKPECTQKYHDCLDWSSLGGSSCYKCSAVNDE